MIAVQRNMTIVVQWVVALDVFDDKGEYALSYIAKDDWYIRPVDVVGQKPTYELVVPLANGDLRIIKVINNKITETVVKQ